MCQGSWNRRIIPLRMNLKQPKVGFIEISRDLGKILLP